MTVMTIGRCEFEEGPTSIDTSGDLVTISGDLDCASYAELTVRRLQLNGLLDNPDEETFPATFVDMPELDGHYFVESVSVGSSPVMIMSPTVPYSVTLRRAADAHAPRAEISWQPITRSNQHSLVGARRIVRRRDQPGWSGAGSPGDVRTTWDGYSTYSVLGSDNAGQWSAPASSWYGAGCAIEIEAAGTWYPIHGRDIDPSVTPSRIRITSGLVRLTFSNSGVITHSIWRSGAWRPVEFGVSVDGGGVGWINMDVFSTPVILRNDIDAAVIRLDARPVSDVNYVQLVGASSLTFTVLAGEWWAGLTVAATADARVRHITPTACTSITGGIRRTTADAAGNRSVIALSWSLLRDLTTGQVEAASSQPAWSFMVAQAPGGSLAGPDDTEAAIVQQWIGTYAARTRVLAR